MRGYFGVGVEGLSKQMNAGNVVRTAHAFGAAFFFTIGIGVPYAVRKGGRADTSNAPASLPVFNYADAEALRLPEGCALVGIEIADDAVALPTFRHPHRAAYVLGAERGGLSTKMTERCDYLVKIPTKFSINVAVAGAIVIYDRLLNLGRFGSRPLIPGGAGEAPPSHMFGEPVRRRRTATGKQDDTAPHDQPRESMTAR